MKVNRKQKQGPISKDDMLTRPMIPIEQCRAIMNRDGFHYTDEELILMRDFMYRLAEIMVALYERKKSEGKIISINKNNEYDKAESVSLYPCEYGRTG